MHYGYEPELRILVHPKTVASTNFLAIEFALKFSITAFLIHDRNLRFLSNGVVTLDTLMGVRRHNQPKPKRKGLI